MNIITEKTLVDLEFYDKVYPNLNNTITTYGNHKLESLFQTLYWHPNQLNRRQQILKTASTPNIRNYLRYQLRLLHDLESDIGWLFCPEEHEVIKDTCFKYNFLNNSTILNISNNMAILSPLIYIGIYLIMYSILYYQGIKINPYVYFMSMYNSVKYGMSIVSKFLFAPPWDELVTNILVNTYHIYQLYSLYSFFNLAITRYYKCKQIKKIMNNVKTAIKIINDIYNYDCLFTVEKQSVNHCLKKLNKIFGSMDIGYSLELYKCRQEYEMDLNNLLQYIGMIDAFLSISMLLDKGYCLPTFSQEFQYNAENIFHPIMPNCVKNSLFVNSNDKTIVITGPNASGKTFFLKSLVLTIFLAQTIGVSNCSKLIFKPFHSLHTQITIPNQVGKASLFEAEIKSYGELFNDIDDNLHLFVSDELFSGTNHQDSNTSSYALYKYMSTLPNVMKIVSTHHHEILRQSNHLTDQYRFDQYKLQKGLYDGSNLIQIMNKFNLNKEIINNAIDFNTDRS